MELRQGRIIHELASRSRTRRVYVTRKFLEKGLIIKSLVSIYDARIILFLREGYEGQAIAITAVPLLSILTIKTTDRRVHQFLYKRRPFTRPKAKSWGPLIAPTNPLNAAYLPMTLPSPD